MVLIVIKNHFCSFFIHKKFCGSKEVVHCALYISYIQLDSPLRNEKKNFDPLWTKKPLSVATFTKQKSLYNIKGVAKPSRFFNASFFFLGGLWALLSRLRH